VKVGTGMMKKRRRTMRRKRKKTATKRAAVGLRRVRVTVTLGPRTPVGFP